MHVALALAVWIGSGFGLGLPTGGEPRRDALTRVAVVGDKRPERVAWVLDNGPSPLTVSIQRDTDAIELPAGTGCLVMKRAGSTPVALELSLVPGSTTTVASPKWAPGTTLVGRVVDETGAVVPATVTVHSEPQRESDKSRASCAAGLRALGITFAEVDSDGRFLLGPLAKAGYRLRVEAEGYRDATAPVHVSGESARVTVPQVTLRAVATLHVELDSQEIEDEPPFTLAVSRENPRSTTKSQKWQSVTEEPISPAQGLSFELAPGSYRLLLKKAGTDLMAVRYLELSQGEAEVVLRPRPIVMEIEVLDEGTPVAGVLVRVLSRAEPVVVTTGWDGRCSVRLWSPDSYAVRIETTGGDIVDEIFDLSEAEPGDTVRRTITLPRGTLKGVVVSARDKRPVAHAAVRLRQELEGGDKVMRSTATADTNGGFEFHRIRVGAPSSISVDAKGFLPTTMPVDVVAGGAAAVVVEVEPATAVHGHVVSSSGQPVAGARVGCCAPEIRARFSQSAVSEADGGFTLDASPGAVVFAAAAGYSLAWNAVGDGELTLVMPPRQAPTRLRVAARDETPIAGAAVIFAAPDGVVIPYIAVYLSCRLNLSEHRTTGDGELLVDFLPPGTYRALLITARGLVDLGAVPIPSAGVVTLYVPESAGT